MINATCGDCLFSVPDDYGKSFTCRALPPRARSGISATGDEEHWAEWPAVEAETWACGRFVAEKPCGSAGAFDLAGRSCALARGHDGLHCAEWRR